tara:strand:+ start:322 stop:1062 length:741 start_codon:yes stop_codon:yes gene_type:complete
MQTHFDLSTITTVISPFFGGGSFEFFLQSNHGFKIVANDMFYPLVTFWKTCKSADKKVLCSELREQMATITKDKFLQLRNSIMTESDPMKQALLYFIINRCSFSGSTLSGGFSQESSTKRFTKSSIDRVEKLNLSQFDIQSKHFKDFIEELEIELKTEPSNSLMFLDPPYYLGRKSSLYGKNGDMHRDFDHQELFTVLKYKKKWMMTYNNCDYIRNLYKDFEIIETNWAYGMNKTKKSSELVIISR